MFSEFNAPQPVFGMALGSHLERSCREIASVLEECVTALFEYGIEEEVCVWKKGGLPDDLELSTQFSFTICANMFL